MLGRSAGALLAWVVVPCAVCAATYHVGSGGGLAKAGAPWPSGLFGSIDEVNAAAFEPGDRILFERGGQYDGDLVVRSSGTHSAPIFFGAYGEGEKPLVRGTIRLEGATHVTISGLSVRPDRRLAKSAAGSSTAAVHAASADYTTISDLNTSSDIRLLYSSYSTVERCTVDVQRSHSFGICVGFWWGSADDEPVDAPHDIVIRDNVVTGAVWAGIDMMGQGYDDRLHDFEVYGNHCHGNGEGIYTHYCRDGAVYDNHSHDNTLFLSERVDKGEGYGLGLQTSSAIRVWGNSFHDNRTSAIEIWGGTEGSGSSGAYGPSDSNEVFGNEFYGNGELNANDQTGGGKYGIFLTGVGRGQSIHHNVIRDNRGGGIMVGTHTDSRILNNTLLNDNCHFLIEARRFEVKNNIFADGAQLRGYPSDNDNTCTRNLFSDAANDYFGSTDDIVGDPLFVNASGDDYHLEENSPAVDQGLDVGLTEDYDGNVITGTPDIGAFEYQASTGSWSVRRVSGRHAKVGGRVFDLTGRTIPNGLEPGPAAHMLVKAVGGACLTW